MMKPKTDAAITSTVSGLSDQRLLERTKELAGIEHQINVVVIDHLRELERRRLYLTIGFSSLFDYAVHELGYSDAAAWRRIKAMRLCAGVEGTRERLRDGSLTMAELQHAFDRQERKQAGFGRGARAGARPAATPDGPAPAATACSAERPAAPVLDGSARHALVKQAAGKSTRQVREMLADVDPELAAQADRMRPLGADRWELKAAIDGECRHGLERLRGLLSHVDPHMTLGQLVGRLVQEGLDRHDPGRPPRGRRTGSRAADKQTSAPKVESGPNRAQTSAPKKPTAANAALPTALPAAGTPAELTNQAKWDAAQRTALPTRGATSAPKVDAESVRGGTSAPKRPERRARTGSSAPKKEHVRQRHAQPAAQRPSRREDTATSTPPQPRVIGRAIPAAVRREVWERDQGCCSYVDRGSGRRCGSRRLLQVDHVLPYALGGRAEPGNLRLLCAAHHRHRHATERCRPPE